MLNKNFWKNKKVLITGFNGFKGSWMTLMLYFMGAKVHGFSLNNKQNKINEKSFNLKKICSSIYHGDIQDLDKLRYYFNKVDPDLCIHMAAQPLVFHSYKFPKKTFEINFNGTLNLLEIIRIKKNKVIPTLIVTSDKCYINNQKKKYLDENDHLGGDDPYSASKAAAEVLVNSYIKSYDLRIATVRGGNVFGGGDWNSNRLVPDIIKSIFLKKKLIIRNPEQFRPFQFVLDVNFSYLKILKIISFKKKYCSSYNIGPNKSYKVSDLLNYYKKHLRGKLEFKKNKFFEKKAIFLNTLKSNKLGISNIIRFKLGLELTYNWYKVFYETKNATFDYSIKQIKDYIDRDKMFTK